MMGLTYEDIVARIKEIKGLSDEEIKLKVKEKLDKLSGLISNEGAVHIVANELGINLFEFVKQQGVKIQRVMPGMRGVGVLGKVVKNYGVRTFNKDGREGKVCNLLLADETGSLRIVFWDTKQIARIEQGAIKEGTTLRIRDAYVRDNNGAKEMHLGSQSELVVDPPGENVNVDIEQVSAAPAVKKKTIGELQSTDFGVELLATIVQLFEPRFYEACNQCGKKVQEGKCAQHGDVGSTHVPILNIVIDDGTGNIRAVLFRDLVKNILEIQDEQLEGMRQNPSTFEPFKTTLLGKQVLVQGRVQHNEMFDRNEFQINTVKDVDPRNLAQAAAQQE